MLHHLKKLRLVFIITLLVMIIGSQIRLYIAREYWQYSYIRDWKHNISYHESGIANRVEKKLSEPLRESWWNIQSITRSRTYHRAWKPGQNIPEPAVSELEGQNLFREYSTTDSLVAATFTYSPQTGELVLFPDSISLDIQPLEYLKCYLELAYNPEYAGPPEPWKIMDRMDSLRTEIAQYFAFEISDNMNMELKTRHERISSVSAVYGVIWNHAYYKREILPLIESDIESDPQKYNLNKSLLSLEPSEYFYQGILLKDANNDTLLSIGHVQTDWTHPLQSEYQFYWEFPHGYRDLHKQNLTGWAARGVAGTPRWKLWAHDHYQMNPGEEFWEYHYLNFLPDDHAAAVANIMNNIFRPDRDPKLDYWTTMLIGLGLIFVIIIDLGVKQERHRNFIAIVSHDLKTPVARLKLFTESLLHDRTISNDQEKEYLQNIDSDVDHLSRLIDNGMQLCKLDFRGMKLNISIVQPGVLLEEVYSNWKTKLEEDGFEFNLEIKNSLPRINADTQALKLVLWNLLDNAVKYSPKVKNITLGAVHTSDSTVRIYVADRGPGIPEAKRKAIFNRFYRFKHPYIDQISGSGLGLAIVRKIVKKHGGKVRYESRDGGGSKFIVDLKAG